jgi:hypothetical protein
MDDYVPSCIEEKKMLERAKQRLQHAEQKLEAVRTWKMASNRAVDEFQGPVQQLMGMLDSDIPRAISLLEKMSAALARYTAIGAPAGVKWEDLLRENAEESMAQSADDAERPVNEADQSVEATATIDAGTSVVESESAEKIGT